MSLFTYKLKLNGAFSHYLSLVLVLEISGILETAILAPHFLKE